MKKRGIFNVNEERLKEFMANGTDAEGTPKTPFAEEKTTRAVSYTHLKLPTN